MGRRISLPVCTSVTQRTLIKMHFIWVCCRSECTLRLFGQVWCLSLECAFARDKAIGQAQSLCCIEVMYEMERAEWCTPPPLFPCEVRVKLADPWLLNNKRLLRRSSAASMPGLYHVLGSGAVLVCGLLGNPNLKLQVETNPVRAAAALCCAVERGWGTGTSALTPRKRPQWLRWLLGVV